MSAWDGLNRRKFPRVRYPCLIIIRSEHDKQESFLTHTENLGAGGVCIILKQQLKLFAEVEVEIDLMDMEDHIRSQGKVVWSIKRRSEEKTKPSFYDLGIEFEDLKDENQRRVNNLVQRIVKQKERIIPYS